MTMKEYQSRLKTIAILGGITTMVFVVMPICHRAFFFTFLEAIFMTGMTTDAMRQSVKAKEEEDKLQIKEILDSKVLFSYDWECIAGIERLTAIILFCLSFVSMMANIYFH